MKRWMALPAALLAAFAAQAADYALDPTHTSVTFEAVHFGTSTSRGRFERISGSVRFDRSARTGRVEIEIATASISTGVPALDGRLRGADFLDVERHPAARFVAEQLVFDDAAPSPKVVEARGELTLLGRTLPLVLHATSFNCYPNLLLLREVCGGDFEATLERSRWGMDRAMDVAPDTIRLLVQVEAIRQ